MTSLHLLTNLSQHDYALLYDKVLQVIKKSLSNEQYDDLVNKATITLKKRQAFLLPINADSETIYRQQDAWTYGVFIATLFYYYPTSISIDEFNALIPTQALCWLKSYEPLQTELSAYLSCENNVFSRLINPHEVVIKEEINNHTSPGKTSTCKTFFTWLQEQLNNHACQSIYRIDLGYFIEMPKYFELYQQTTKDKSCLLEEIYHHPALIENEQQQVLHHYCLGDWQKRHTLSGIIIKASALTQLRQTLPLTTDLHPDPLHDMT